MTAEDYKKRSVKEFDHAAVKFDDSDPSIYNMCRKDCPDVLKEVEKEAFESLLDAGCGTGAMIQLFIGIVQDIHTQALICQRK